MSVSVPQPGFGLSFGAAETGLQAGDGGFRLSLQVPLLRGPAWQPVLEKPMRVEASEGFAFGEGGERLAGAFTAEAKTSRDCEAIARRAYHSLLARTEGWSLYRIWQFVPGINRVTGGLEHYRGFCAGRAQAFSQAFQGEAPAHMPAASAVGIDGTTFALAFVAGRAPAAYYENPQQVPAYRYPIDYGPRPPSFARASAMDFAEETYGYLSGTASIKGHATVGAGDLSAQLLTTLDNLRLMAARVGAHARGRPAGARRFTVYLRRPDALPATAAALEAAFPGAARATYVRADICRAELEVEIEAELSFAPAVAPLSRV